MQPKEIQQKNPLIADNLERMRRTSPHQFEEEGQEGFAANLFFGTPSSPRDLAEKLMRQHGVSRTRALEMISEGES
jgi:hypothetical protein